ncbi:MAG: hypothetical protein ACE5PV_15025 [Candidatus Poribacteria bacterium]
MYTKFFLRTAFLLFLGLMVAGCGVKARVDIYMEPVVSGDEYLDAKTGAMTIEKEGVSITVEPLDASDMLMLTDDEDINPYIEVDFWRHAKPLYTIFDINIHNTRDSKVVVDSPAVLIDENGEQYSSLPYDYFKDIYDAASKMYTEIVYPYYGYRYYYPYSYYPYRYYSRPYYIRRVDNQNARELKSVARETIFDGAKLFSGARRGGLLVFERLDEGATDVRLLIPEVIVYDGRRKHKLNFEFNFRQVVSVKE